MSIDEFSDRLHHIGRICFYSYLITVAAFALCFFTWMALDHPDLFKQMCRNLWQDFTYNIQHHKDPNPCAGK